MKSTTILLRYGLLIAGLSALTGCEINEEKLSTWARVSGGHQRLAGYMADTQRPEVLRLHAAMVLLDAGRIAEIMYVLDKATPRDRKRLVQALANNVVQYIDKEDDRMKMRAASFAYFLFQHAQELTGNNYNEPRDKVLVERVVGWILERLKIYDSLPKGKQRPEEILLAAAHAFPKLALPMIYGYLESPPDLRRFLIVNRVLDRLPSKDVKAKQAHLLLAYAQKTYPKVEPELAEVMSKNQNETLLRFLLDAASDHRVPANTRAMGLQGTALLKLKAIPGLLKILRTDEPKNENTARLNALDLIWKLGGRQHLREALETLPATGTWWPEGTQFKDYVDEFCDDQLKPNAEAVRPILTALIDHPNWVTNVYAMECSIRLYADAVSLLEPLVEDPQVLRGWSDDGDITVGEYVKSLSATAQ